VLTAAVSPHPRGNERWNIFTLKVITPKVSEVLWGWGELGELPGEHGEGCVYPSASHTLS